MYEDYTPESIKNEILENLTKWDTREGSFVNNMVSAVSYEMWKVLQSLNACIPIAFVDETSGEYIDKRASEFGLERKSGTKAAVSLTFTGKEGAVINAGSVFLTEDGLEYILIESIEIGSSLTATGTAEAAEAGEIYNVKENTITVFGKDINGAETVTNGTEAVGGTDEETDESLVNRLYEYWQKPATSGNVYHYRLWAKAVDGIGEAKIFPLWNGNGTVKVVICSSEMKSVNSDTVSKCKEYIESVRPIGATVTVESAVQKGVTVKAVVTKSGIKTAEGIKAEFEENLTEYLKKNAFKAEKILYHRIAYLLMDIDGVENYTTLTVNGSTADITIAQNEIAVLSGVEVS